MNRGNLLVISHWAFIIYHFSLIDIGCLQPWAFNSRLTQRPFLSAETSLLHDPSLRVHFHVATWLLHSRYAAVLIAERPAQQ